MKMPQNEGLLDWPNRSQILRFLLRIIASPFVLGLILVSYVAQGFVRWFNFIKYGGEFASYYKDERKTIFDIYNKLKKNHEKESSNCAL